MTRYFFVILLMGLIGVAIVVKAGITMFAERQYWQDVADRFVKENVTVKPNRGNILSSDGKLMASSLPEYRIYMDFKAGGEKKDTMLMNHLGEICEGLHQIFPDNSESRPVWGGFLPVLFIRGCPGRPWRRRASPRRRRGSGCPCSARTWSARRRR